MKIPLTIDLLLIDALAVELINMELVPPFKVKSQYAYTSEYEDDLNFAEGQIITVTEIEDDEWFSGAYDGKSGMFPRNFVTILEDEEKEQKHSEESTAKTTNPATANLTKEQPVDVEDSEEEKAEEEKEKEGVHKDEHKKKENQIHPIDTKVDNYVEAKSELSEISHDIPSPSAIRKKTLESEIKPISPSPIFPGSKPADSYGIKKQFLGVGKSSYIPPIQPRDDSKIQSHIHKEIPINNDIVRESSINTQEVSQEEGPKLSLKERIALLQKRQEEEEEREKAALLKKQEKKKKLKEENERKKEKIGVESSISNHEHQHDEIKNHENEKEIHGHSPEEKEKEIEFKQTNDLSKGASGNVLTIDHTTGDENQEHKIEKVNKEEDETEENEEEEKEEEDEEEKEEEDEEDEEDEEEDDEDDDEEEDEDAKRRKLVERMAKISGGRNMFGMMGMSPFGNPHLNQSEKTTKKKKTSISKKNKNADFDTPSLPKAVPILPFANKSDLPEALVNNNILSKEVKDDDAAGENQEKDESESDIGVNKTIQGNIEFQKSYSRADYIPKVEESSSLPEEDDFTESDIKASRDEELNLQRTTSSSSSTIDPEEKLENEQSENSITLNKEPLEKQATGYDADLDLSDAKKNSLNESAHGNLNEEFTESIENADSSSPIKHEHLEGISSHFPHSENVTQEGSENYKPRSLPPVSSIPSSIPPIPSSIPPIPNSIPAVPSSIPAVPSSIPAVPSSIPAIPSSIPAIPSSIPSSAPPLPDAVPPAPEIPSMDKSLLNKTVNDEYVDVPDTDSDFENHNEDEFNEIQNLPTTHTSIPPISSKSLTFDLDNSSIGHKSSSSKPLARSSTIDIVPRKSNDTQLRRSISNKSNDSHETQAEISLKDLEFEIANVNGNSNWWLRGELPDILKSKIGSELIYEVDSNYIKKRGNRIVQYRDYYVLFYDLSQIVFELEYEQEDPRSTIKLINFFCKEIPIIRKDLLDRYHLQFGGDIVNQSLLKLNAKLNEDIVSNILSSQKDIIKPIGNKSFGVTIYKNNNNSNIAKIDEIKSGDILWIKNGKFNVHKGLIGTGKTIAIGEGAPHASIIAEFDPKKEKFKVIESDSHGIVKKESYKISEFKSGRIRVFRVVGKEYVDW